jgi:hypothetical protein
MSNDTNLENGQPEDNELIRELRGKLKDANKAIKSAGDDAVAKVKRQQTAANLMPKGFEGLSDVFEAEVDGDLDPDAAAKWLASRGFGEQAPESTEEKEAEAAEGLERVTNLGGAVAAAGSLTPEGTVSKQLKELAESGDFKDITSLSEAVAAVLNG